MQKERIDTKYYEIVAKDGEDIIMLDYTFDHGDGFKGATGTLFSLVSKGEYEERTNRANIEDEYKWLWQEAVQAGKYEGSYSDYVDKLMEDVDSLVFDKSYSHMHNKIRKVLGVSEEYYPMITCTGGGRIFKHKNDYEIVYRPDLIEVISQFETI